MRRVDRQKGRKSGKRLRSVALLVLLLVLVLLFILPDETGDGSLAGSLYRGLLVGEDYGVAVDSFALDTFPDSRIVFHRGGVAVTGPTGYAVYDANGVKAYVRSGIFTEPSVVSANQYLLLFDRGGTDITLLRGSQEIFHREWPETIQTARVEERGYLLIITRYTVSLLSPQQDLLYEYHMSRRVPIDAAISFGTLAVVTVEQVGMNLEACLVMLDTSKEQPIAECLIGDIVPLHVFPVAGGIFGVMTEESVVFFSGDGTRRAEYSFDGRKLKSFCDFGDHGILLCLDTGDGRQTECGLLSPEGAYRRFFQTDEDTFDVQAAGGYFMVRFPGYCEVYNADGTLIAVRPETGGAHKVFLADDGSLLSIFSDHAVRVPAV